MTVNGEKRKRSGLCYCGKQSDRKGAGGGGFKATAQPGCLAYKRCVLPVVVWKEIFFYTGQCGHGEFQKRKRKISVYEFTRGSVDQALDKLVSGISIYE